MNEHEAIARMKQGDIDGLAVLVELYQVQAVRTAFLITQNRALAEDVVQSTFIRIYQRIDQFDISRPFAPWFLRSVANAAIQAAKREQRQVSLDASLNGHAGETAFLDLLHDPNPGPDAAAEAADTRSAVWEALQHLSPEQRAAVVLRYYTGLSEQEMADALDSPPGTIKWRLHAARRQLRVLLRRFSGEPDPDWQEG